MKLFFDTSSLVKYFHNEEGSIQVISLIDDLNNHIHISSFKMVSELDWKFVVSDKQLSNIANKLGIDVIFI